MPTHTNGHAGDAGTPREIAFEEELECALDDRDRLALSEAAATAEAEHRALVLEKSIAVANFNRKIAHQKSERETYLRWLHAKKQPRMVRCIDEHVHALGEVRTIRTDTGETVRVRPMRLEERQPELPGLGRNPVMSHHDEREWTSTENPGHEVLP